MIQLQLATTVRDAIARAQSTGALPPFDIPQVVMERPARKEHGDWSTGIALVCARVAGKQPREIAAAIVEALGDVEHVMKIDIAGPGFINFALSHQWLTNIVRDVVSADTRWGESQGEEPEKIQVEFVSANPTGPMHLGHGRWAAIGDTLARLLVAAGHTVEREFYINDYGRQIRLFGESIAARYLGLFTDRTVEIPEGGYQGSYVIDIAKEILVEVGDRYLDADPDERATFMGIEGKRRMLLHQRETLQRFGVEFDVWFSETSMHDEGAVERLLEVLRSLGHVYEADGATWLRTTDFGDEKDRVLVRSDGMPHYRLSDLAYFLDKLRRGFQRIVYLWGADHHGHVKAMQAGILALGEDPEHCEFLLGQFVHLVRGKETVSMSKRQGEGVTFDQLIDEVGVDAARYHFLRTSMDQTVNFDLDLVVSQSQENPVYYVQYAHARISSIMRRAETEGVTMRDIADVPFEELQHESELDLLRKIAELPEAVEVAGRLRAPHRMTRYAEELASLFHAFYRDCRVVSEDEGLTQARLWLCRATQVALRNTLTLLGVSAPESM
jgi:arginyl-tRNA synthetase